MILPGNIFLDQKIKFKNLIHIGTLLVFMNVLIYLCFTLPEFVNDQKIYKLLNQNKTLRINTLKNMYDQTVDPLIQSKVIGLSFLKDKLFWSRSNHFPFQGDAVEIEKNKKILTEIQNMYKNSSQFQFGLGHEATTPGAWLTYQFTHAGFMHLIMNMIFLILIVNILITRVDAEFIFLVYILGGLGAGISYLFFSGSNEISMVGASGSLCALMAFLSTTEHKKNIQWSYFLSPIKNGYGIIYMPAFLLFPIYLLSDFTTILYHSNGIDRAIAHSAHIGGALTGFLMGLVYLFWSKTSAHRVFSDNDGFHKLL